MLFTVTIPEELAFGDLNLAIGEDGDVVFSWRAIDAICAASGINPAIFRDGPKDNVASLIAFWYVMHRSSGGDAEKIIEERFSEVLGDVMDDVLSDQATKQQGGAT